MSLNSLVGVDVSILSVGNYKVSYWLKNQRNLLILTTVQKILKFRSFNMFVRLKSQSYSQVQGKIIKLCWNTKHERRTKKIWKDFIIAPNCFLFFAHASTWIAISFSEDLQCNDLKIFCLTLLLIWQDSRSSSLILFALLCHLDKWW